jgi:hypothetical protein
MQVTFLSGDGDPAVSGGEIANVACQNES